MMSSATTIWTIYRLWNTGACPGRDRKTLNKNVLNAVLEDAISNMSRSKLPRVLL
jgi:hypothetical protein